MATAGGTRGPGPERAFAPDLTETGRVVLDAEESAHLIRSRRARVGDGIVLFDGRGTTCLGRLVEADGRAAVVEIEGPYPDRRPARHVRLAASLPEAGRADRMVSALAELGVAEFAPLLCARTPARRGERRRPRWERLAREAAKINGCGRLLAFRAPLAFEAALEAGSVLLDPDPGAPLLSSALGDAVATPWLLIGPEGGFTEDELHAAGRQAAAFARVGDTALRTENAAVSAAAIALAWAPDVE